MSVTFFVLEAMLVFSTGTLLARHAAERNGCRVRLRADVALAGTATLVLAIAGSRSRFPESMALLIPAVAIANLSAATDAQTGYIFDSVVVFGAIVALAIGYGEGRWQHMIFGSIAGASLPLALHVASDAKGLGFGDVKLATLLGAFEGPTDVLRTLAIACILAGAFGVWLVLSRRSALRDTIPFGPFLAMGVLSIAGWTVWR